jgi:hypothetical protein
MRWYQRFFRRSLTEKHLDAELQFHLDRQTADYIAAGMKPEEARRRARLEFGGLDQVKEECRDLGSARFIETLVQDLRFGLRRQAGWRRPVFQGLRLFSSTAPSAAHLQNSFALLAFPMMTNPRSIPVA